MSSRRRRLRRLFQFALLVLVLMAIEMVARAGWSTLAGVSPLRVPAHLYRVFHPQLHIVQYNDFADYDADFRILLLGGSAVAPHWGAVEQVLRERLVAATGRPVRIDNLGADGHTTLDSLIKYRRLRRHRYDMIIVYHGINDFRANNVPAELFQPDYSHYAWYEMLLHEERVGRRWLALPFTLRWGWVRLSERLGLRDSLSPDRLPAQWLPHGAEIKTRQPFQENLRTLAELAAERGDPLMLMTFAAHLPPDYTHQRFLGKQLDYTLHLSAAQLWGHPPFVMAGIAAHNEAVRELARQRPEIILVDQAALIPREGAMFNDICHLTVVGSMQWVDNALPPILERFARKPLPPRDGPAAPPPRLADYDDEL